MEKKFSLFQLSWPIFIENLLRLSLGLVNVYMISKFSERAVGAVGVANEIISIPLVLFSIVGTGTAVTINQYLGSNQNDKAKVVAKVSILINLLFGLLLSLLVVIFAEQLLHLIKLDENRISIGATYLRIVGGAIFIQALISTMSGIFRSYGFTSLPMKIALISNLINVISNYLVVYRPFNLPELGVLGIAITNVFAISISCLLMFRWLFDQVQLKFSLNDIIKLPYSIVRDILKIGIPSAGEFISYRGSQLMTAYFINIMIVSYDAVNTRIYTANIMNFVYMIGMSIGQATLILVGHNVGAKKYETAYKLAIKNLKYAILINTSVAIIAALNGKLLLNIFTNNPDIIKVGSILLFIMIIIEPGRSYNLVIVNALRAAGDVRYPVIIGILSMWLLSVPLCYILGIHYSLGLIGVWIAFAVDEWTRGFILYLRWKKRKWMQIQIIK